MGLELKLKAVLVSVAAAACVSCTSELKVGEGNMDLTITVGGDSLMLPLGSTESMGISDFLDLDSVDFLYVDEYGNYYLEMTDTFEEEVAVSDFAESMTVEGIDRNFDDRDFTVYSDATGIGADFDFEEEFTYLFSFQDAKDSGLVSISYVNLENTYLLPRVHLEADKTIPESMVVSLEVIVPEKYVFEDVPAVNGTTVTFEGNVSSSGDVNFQPVMMESIELNLGENDPFEFEDVFTVNNLSISVDQAEMTEFEVLQLRVKELEAENALLKKVKALVEARDARLREIGRKPSNN